MEKLCPECGRQVEGRQQVLLGKPLVVGSRKEGWQPVLEFECRCGFLCVLTQELAEFIGVLPRERLEEET